MTSAAAAVAPCWFCSASRPPQATFCPQCGRAALVGCVAVMRTGKSYVLGRHADGGFAVWDQTVQQPVDRYGPADFGQANRELDFAENMPAVQPTMAVTSQRSNSSLITIVILVLVFAGIYLYVHAHRYSGCTFTSPGIFEWPSSCL